ncbi:hypothetical protein [Sorangium cellulosum]|uniref:hypothetical protein n=1 Tax=Sorangium cellulosum TaxID=56 RepID=UPI003D9AA722
MRTSNAPVVDDRQARKREQPREHGLTVEGDDQEREADQDEQHRVQDLVHQLPEIVQVFAGLLAHRAGARFVPDEEPGHH